MTSICEKKSLAKVGFIHANGNQRVFINCLLEKQPNKQSVKEGPGK